MKRLLRFMRRSEIPQLPPLDAYATTEAAQYLRQLMAQNYTTADLKNVAASQFQTHITSLPGRRDARMEGYDDADRQRDLSVEFEWGHNHDFGDFYMAGRMEDRHINILAAFMSEYGTPARQLKDEQVLDVGCWTGGTSLLLAAMGAEVFAIEEVHKYAECLRYMRDAFGLGNLTVENRSLYSLDSQEFFDRFDLILYFGVLYHVTDPVLSLRILFNCLKDGGACLIEAMAVKGAGRYCEYWGAQRTAGRPRAGSPRGGWNWFVPSLKALCGMATDVGFKVQRATLHQDSRALALAARSQHVDMLRAGLSRRDVR